MATKDHPLMASSTKRRSRFTRRFGEITAEMKTILILALVTFLNLTAYIPIESLQSSLNSEGGLGTYSLACIYGAYFVVAIAAPCVVRFLTPKWAIFTQFAADIVYCAANFYPTWYTLIPAAALAGSMTGGLWTAKDLIVSHVARQSVEKSGYVTDGATFSKQYQSRLSFYNGIFFASLSFSGVVGQLISSAVLTQSSSSAPSGENCGAFSSLGGAGFSPKFTNATHNLNKPEEYLVYTLLGILTSLVVLAMFVTAFCLRNVPSGNTDKSFRTTLFSCAVRCTDTKMLLLIPQMALLAFPSGLIMSDYTKAYIACGAGVGMVGYVMISGSLVATLTSVGCGHLVKYTGRTSQVVVALFGYVAVYLMMWLWTPVVGDNIMLYLIVPMIFRASDVIYHTHICTAITLMFDDDKAAAFANFYTFRSLFQALSFASSGFVNVRIKLIISTTLLCLGSVSFLFLEVKCNSRQSDTNDEKTID